MPGIYSKVIILIDTSSFCKTELQGDLIDHVKEAVSYQISRGAITNKKLIRLGLEPYLARVKWTYIFFDSTHTNKSALTTTDLGQSMKTLTYDCWDLFEKELNEQVKSNSPKDNNISVNNRMKNVIKFLENLKFHHYWPNETRCSNPDLVSSSTPSTSTTSYSIESYNIIVFTSIPKLFSCLVHLATGLTNCKHSMSLTANCSPENIQMCFVDVRLDSTSLHDYTGLLDKLPCFWDDVEVCNDSQRLEYSSLPGKKISLKIACMKKLMMIHKLMEMRFPWMYGHSLPFGLGMKRLRQWEWTIPQEIPRSKRSGCLSLRKCCSEETYYLDET